MDHILGKERLANPELDKCLNALNVVQQHLPETSKTLGTVLKQWRHAVFWFEMDLFRLRKSAVLAQLTVLSRERMETAYNVNVRLVFKSHSGPFPILPIKVRYNSIEVLGDSTYRREVVLPPMVNSVRVGGDGGYTEFLSIKNTVWPKSLITIKFGDCFNQPVVHVTWPPGLETLCFGRFFDQPLGGMRWPACLKDLVLGESFSGSLHDAKLPPFLVKLSVMSERFDCDLKSLNLPNRLRYLGLGHGFTTEILGHLPCELVELTLAGGYNHPLLTSSLTDLQKIDLRVLPNMARYKLGMGFKDSFNQDLVGTKLGDSITSIFLGDAYTQSVIGVTWPRALTELNLGWEWRGTLPLYSDTPSLPDTLTSLTVGDEFMNNSRPLRHVVWPLCLRVLDLGHVFELQWHSIGKFPECFRLLKVGSVSDRIWVGLKSHHHEGARIFCSQSYFQGKQNKVLERLFQNVFSFQSSNKDLSFDRSIEVYRPLPPRYFRLRSGQQRIDRELKEVLVGCWTPT